MAAKLVTSSFIKSLQHGGKSVSVEYATKTTAWQRYLCATELQMEFAAVTEENKSQLPPGTALVAMKESEHQSENDKRKHYSAFCKDANGNDLPTQHFVKQL
ncbi:MAG: hypothetical protein Q9217_006713 [Psora testacea]